MKLLKLIYVTLGNIRSLYIRLIENFKSFFYFLIDYTIIFRFRFEEYLFSNLIFLNEYYSKNKEWKLGSLYILDVFKNNEYNQDYIYYWNLKIFLNKSGYKSVKQKKSDLMTSIWLNFRFEYLNYDLFYRKIEHTTNLFYRVSWYYTIKLYVFDTIKRTFSFGFQYLYGFSLILFIDACITDDEPLWEPIEWSLVQSWILFIFTFAWIAENLIVSRYGSYTGRDKRVWMSWYKTFWLIEGFYVINYGVTCLFVIVPFYYETNYNLSFIYSWWHWYSRVFFFKFISIYAIVLLIANLLQTGTRWLNWKKSLMLIIVINLFLSYLLYTHFIISFFGYFTDPVWYQKVRPIDYIQLSHEPARWGWGSAKKDHFTYHNVKTVFWFKNDGPFASSFLLFHLFLFVCLFLTYFWWISLFRKVFTTKEVPATFLTYCVSSLRQFFYFFLWMYIFIFLSYMSNYWRFPLDMYFMLNNDSWLNNFVYILTDYIYFLLSIFFK